MSKYKVWIYLILANLFWAGNYVFGKYVGKEMTPLGITFTRWAIASFLLLGIAQWVERPDWRHVLKSWPTLAGMGITGVITFNFTLYAALQYTSSVNAAMVSALNPALIVIASAILLKDKLSGIQTLGISISLAGVLVIITGGNLIQIFQMNYNLGDFLMLISITAWTLYSILGKRLKEVPPVTATAISAMMATLLMSPFAISQGISLRGLSPVAGMGLLYIIIFPSIFSFMLWNIGLRAVGVARAGIFLNLIPLFTVAISWFLGEKTNAAQALGGLLVLSGVFLTTGFTRKT